MANKHQCYNGIKFTRDDKTGYYLNSTIHKRLHRYVWEQHYGPIPKGFEIHHIDFDKSNNDISNLKLLSKSEHRQDHAKALTTEQREWRRNNLNEKARPKAIEWHKSDIGREWHKEHYKQTAKLLHKIEICTCLNCGKEFSGELGSKYCSNACKSEYRRKQGVDNTERICVICGKAFITNKYSKKKCCSRVCGAKLGHQK